VDERQALISYIEYDKAESLHAVSDQMLSSLCEHLGGPSFGTPKAGRHSNPVCQNSFWFAINDSLMFHESHPKLRNVPISREVRLFTPRVL
jgi:hypothetical protein